MADRQARAIYAGIGVALTVGLSLLSGAEISLSVSEGLWFELTIYVVVAAFLLEPNYSGGGASTTNAVAVSFVALGADPQRYENWWVALALVSLGTVSLSLVASALGSDASPATRTHRASRVARKVSRSVGSWRALLLACLALSLLTFDPAFGDEWTVALLVTIYCLLVAAQPPHQLWRELKGSSPSGGSGIVHSVHPPSELVVTMTDLSLGLTVGSLVSIASGAQTFSAVVTERVFADGLASWRMFAPELQSHLSHNGSRAWGRQVEVEICDEPAAALERVAAELSADSVEILGSLTEGTSIRSAEIDLNPGRTVELGDVLWTGSGEGRTYWQVADATLRRSSWAGDTRRVARVEAVQIGRWDPDEVLFDADTRSPLPADIVLGGHVEAPPGGALSPGLLQIGTLPRTAFPVVIDLGRLSRTHAAVLGTTGTGKTHLSFALIEALFSTGVKVVCLDLTGQYLQRFPNAVQAKNEKDIVSFLGSNDDIAICSPARGEAITLANRVARAVYDWASSQPKINNTDPAHCVVLLEEAQNFIPEGFVVDDWNLKATAQDTSLVVMESRKFGVGFIVVSQRTAMVTKSALSQCNTVFAFQAVDHTGLDYLEGLCGPVLVKGVPTLPHRTAIVMGRALRSAAPVITQMSDATVVIQ